MSNYQRVIDEIQRRNISWDEIDRIILNPDTYEEFQSRSSFDTSNYATTNAPAIRETKGQEKIVYVAKNGMEVTVEL